MVAAQALVGTHEAEDLRRQRVDRRLLVLHHVAIEVGGPPHGLAGVVDDEVESVTSGHDVLGERFDARCVAQVEAEHLEAFAPVGEVRLGRVASRGVAWKPGDDDERCSAAQQFDPGLVADLDPSTGEQRHGARQVGELAAFRIVELGAVGTELVVEVVDLAVLDLADVAVLLVDGLAIHRIVDVVLAEVLGRVDVRRREHRLVAQRADSRAGEHVLVAPHPLGAPLTLERLGPDPTLLGIGAEHVARRVQQVLFLLGVQCGEQCPIGSDATQERRGAQQFVAEVLLVVSPDVGRFGEVSVQGVRPASGRRS